MVALASTTDDQRGSREITNRPTRIADAMERMAEIAAIEARRDAGMALADDREYLTRIRQQAH